MRPRGLPRVEFFGSLRSERRPRSSLSRPGAAGRQVAETISIRATPAPAPVAVRNARASVCMSDSPRGAGIDIRLRSGRDGWNGRRYAEELPDVGRALVGAEVHTSATEVDCVHRQLPPGLVPNRPCSDPEARLLLPVTGPHLWGQPRYRLPFDDRPEALECNGHLGTDTFCHRREHL